jgi:hypothetical protein
MHFGKNMKIVLTVNEINIYYHAIDLSLIKIKRTLANPIITASAIRINLLNISLFLLMFKSLSVVVISLSISKTFII